jgi:hypothetical protein
MNNSFIIDDFFVLKGPPPNSPNSSMKPLVDLTETSPTKNDNIDVDLEKVSSKKMQDR